MSTAQYLVPGYAHCRPLQHRPGFAEQGSVPQVSHPVPQHQAHANAFTCPPLAHALANTVVTFASEGLAISTRSNYARSWRLFNSFISELQIPVQLPVDTSVITLFVAYLYNEGYMSSSIRSHLSAIAFSNRVSGYPSPTDSFLFSKMLRGVSSHTVQNEQRYPITLPILHNILSVAQHVTQSVYHCTLFSAMCATAFMHSYAVVKCATHRTTCLDNLSIHPSGQAVMITFYSFEYNISKRPFIINITAKTDPCPVSLLLQYLQLQGNRPGSLFCTADGQPVPRATFSNWLNAGLCLLRLPQANYKIHSFCIGAATWALLQGKTESEIQILGRWSSSAFKKYLRLSAGTSL